MPRMKLFSSLNCECCTPIQKAKPTKVITSPSDTHDFSLIACPYPLLLASLMIGLSL
jgi:hypothetical protein